MTSRKEAEGEGHCVKLWHKSMTGGGDGPFIAPTLDWMPCLQAQGSLVSNKGIKQVVLESDIILLEGNYSVLGNFSG